MAVAYVEKQETKPPPALWHGSGMAVAFKGVSGNQTTARTVVAHSRWTWAGGMRVRREDNDDDRSVLRQGTQKYVLGGEAPPLPRGEAPGDVDVVLPACLCIHPKSLSALPSSYSLRTPKRLLAPPIFRGQNHA